MSQQLLQEITIPIDGMTCGGCAASVERALRKQSGVARVVVDLAKKQASIVFDPNQTDLVEFQNAVQSAGYSIPTSVVMLKVEGMTCVSCATHVGGALENLSGVMSAEVSLKSNTTKVAFIPNLVGIPEMAAAIAHVGYKVGEQVGIESKIENQPVSSVQKEEQRFTTGRFERFKKLISKG